MNRQLSLKKVILNDSMSFSAVIWPIGLLAGLFLYYIFNEGIENTLEIMIIFGLFILAEAVILVWRISLFTSVFNDGIETPAVITNTSFFRGRGWIHYTYTYLGQEFKSGNAVMKTKLTSKYQIEDQVVVLIDRNKPKRAFLRDLYMA